MNIITMDLTLTPDTYCPNMDEKGDYVDYIPSFYNGFCFKCPCATRENQTYNSRAKFSAHIKTAKHNNLILSLNHNKSNYYREVMELKEIVKQQREIISNLETKIQIKILTIDYLTKQLDIK
jgi:hypothetical protein